MECTCKHLQQYAKVDTKEKLDNYNSLANKHIYEGTLRLEHDFWSSNYTEKQYTCNHCGLKFVLWIDAVYIPSGGEWRTI